MFFKVGAIFIVLYQELAAHFSHLVYASLLLFYFGVQFIVRAKFSSNISPDVVKFETSWSILSFWISFLLCLRITVGYMFKDIALVSAVSTLTLIGYVLLCFEEKFSSKLLESKVGRRGGSPQMVCRVLENLCFHYGKSKINDKSAKLLIAGYTSEIEERRELESGSPLLVDVVSVEGKAFSKNDKTDDREFLSYISNKYLSALRE